MTEHAKYCFVAVYKGDKSEPSGRADFKFNGLDFESTSYDWLVVTGNYCAKLMGEGTVSGNPGYSFLMTVCDLGPSDGTFRITIWNTTDDEVVYDNLPSTPDDSFDGTDIAGGNIRIEL